MTDEWDGMLIDILKDDGSAAKAMLAANQPIFYAEDDTPNGLFVKEYPDGRREWVRYNESVLEVVRIL